MKTDPAIQEIRDARRRISKRHGHDTEALVHHYMELEKKFKDRMTNKAVDMTSLTQRTSP